MSTSGAKAVVDTQLIMLTPLLHVFVLKLSRQDVLAISASCEP